MSKEALKSVFACMLVSLLAAALATLGCGYDGEPAATIATAELSTSEPAPRTEEAEERSDETFGIANGKLPKSGLLFGGQPTEQQLREAIDQGYGVVNLRMPDEDAGFDEAAVAHELAISYRPIPVNGAALEDPDTYEQFYRALDEAQGPLLVHCASGNRVGALYYAYLVEREGLERDEALERAKENGLRSEALAETVSRYLESRP